MILILMLAGFVQIGMESALGGFDSFPDTEGYIETLHWFSDGSGEEDPLRIQRPLQMLIMLPFEPFIGAESAFIFTNCAFYLLSIPFFYSFSRKVLKDDYAAFITTFLFEFSFCVLYWGLALLTDMILWLMVAIAFDLLVDVKESWRTGDMMKLSLVVGIGVLNKESIAAVALIFVFLFIKSRIGSERIETTGRILPFLCSLVIMALPFVIVQIMMYVYFGPGHTFLDYHLTHKTGDPRGEIWYIPITFLIAFNCLLLLYIPAIARFVRSNGFLRGKEYWASLVLTCLPILAFEQYSPRLSFLIFPFVLPVAAMQLSKMTSLGSDRLRLAVVLAFLIMFAVACNAVALWGDEIRELLGIWTKT